VTLESQVWNGPTALFNHRACSLRVCETYCFCPCFQLRNFVSVFFNIACAQSRRFRNFPPPANSAMCSTWVCSWQAAALCASSWVTPRIHDYTEITSLLYVDSRANQSEQNFVQGCSLYTSIYLDNNSPKVELYSYKS